MAAAGLKQAKKIQSRKKLENIFFNETKRTVEAAIEI